MRMNRWDWLMQFFRSRPRAARERKKGTGRKPDEYRLLWASCEALTKSEARAHFKRLFGLKRLLARVKPRKV